MNIPATGWAIELHQPIAFYLGVELCRDHAKEFFAGWSWDENPELQAMAETMAAGKAAPDFARSFGDVVRIDCSVYQEFLKMRRPAAS